jgi:transcriptional regulator with GAF, ATPase, and Fis domain
MATTAGTDASRAEFVAPLPETLTEFLDRCERETLVQTLMQHAYDQAASAQQLGISLVSLAFRVRRLNITLSGHAD